MTNYDITVDPFLTRKHITAYTLVALPHSGQTMAVLAVTDPTDLKIRVSGSYSYYSVGRGRDFAIHNSACLVCIASPHDTVC